MRPIAGALGAELHGVDLASPLDDETFGEVRQALIEYLVIFFQICSVTLLIGSGLPTAPSPHVW